ncbi:4-alpha-glucanotransferase [Rhizobium sp. RCC_161_2]|uniref:4-alpha-glucanotransferase n=1 Tax=Rhizobium sp. RCC_161_2 TaxID=3239219 RepID=UPI0035262AD1
MDKQTLSNTRFSPAEGKLHRLALQHGIDPMLRSPDGQPVPVSDESIQRLLSALNVNVKGEEEEPDVKFGSDAPSPCPDCAARCFLPEFLSQERVWGLSLQLYELRSGRNWGIGDFEDLKTMIDMVASQGGDFVGLNPLHAPFLADARRCSPYEPSNRLFLNPLYIAVDRLPGFQDSEQSQKARAALRKGNLVDYNRVSAAKLGALRSLWSNREGGDPGESLTGREFENFVFEKGESLKKHAIFEALSAEMVRRGFTAGWHGWPQQYQDVHAPAVVAFANDFQEDVQFHIWLQWVAHQQMLEVVAHARSVLRIGLYLDLAVGEALDGSATWSEPDIYLSGATVGSPPDPFAPNGQDWHLAGFQTSRIASGDNPPFKRMVATAMRYAGAIRIDHAAALRRLFLVPVDSNPADGAYVAYPQEALLRILAEISHHYRCLVIGEDLGLLPDGLQDELAAARILSYRILSYERDDASFKPASAYPSLALACISTHDHQTLAGWWQGADIAARAEHGIVSPELTQRHETERERERRYLREAIDQTLFGRPTLALERTDVSQLTIDAHRFIAKTPCLLAAVRLADLTDEKRPTNIPGTTSSYPNWRPKLSLQIEEIAALPLVSAITQAMLDGRTQPLDRSAESLQAKVSALRADVARLRRAFTERQSRTPRSFTAGMIKAFEGLVHSHPYAAVYIASFIGYRFGRRH